MSEDEKEAVEYWKGYMEILHWNTQLASEHHMKVLLDLIEKQQKELEQEKEKNKEVVCIPEGTCFMLKPKNTISKDKIKEILERYKYTEIGDSTKIITFYKEIQELLEEK